MLLLKLCASSFKIRLDISHMLEGVIWLQWWKKVTSEMLCYECVRALKICLLPSIQILILLN